MEALGRVQKSNEDLAALLRMMPRGRSPNASLAAEGSPTLDAGRNSLEPRNQSVAAPSELPVIKLQLENMELNLQSANEEMKRMRIKCEKSQSELVDAQMEVVRSQRTLDNLTKQNSELHVRAKQADWRIQEAEEEIKIVTSEHTNYARMVFRLSKRSCTLLRRWSHFPSPYSTRACFGSWVATVRRARQVRKFMHASALRRRCCLKRATLYTWLRRAAAAAAQNAGTSNKEESSPTDRDDVRHALGIITNIISGSPKKTRSRDSSPAFQSHKSPQSLSPAVQGSPQGFESAATSAILANSLSTGLSALASQPHKNGPQNSRAPLDNLQKLKNAYHSLNSAGGHSSHSSFRNSPEGSAVRAVGKESADNTGPLAWFLQQYADETKHSQAQGLNTHSSHAPPDASRDLEVISRRFQKLNGLEVGTKTMVNPDQNVVVEADLGVHLTSTPGRKRSGYQQQFRPRFRDRERSRSPDSRTARGHRDREGEGEQDLRGQNMTPSVHERARQRADTDDRPLSFDTRGLFGPPQQGVWTSGGDSRRDGNAWDRSQDWGLKSNFCESAMSTPFNKTQQGVAAQRGVSPTVRGFQFSSTSPLLPTSRPSMGTDVGQIAPFAHGPGPHAPVSPMVSPVRRQYIDGQQQHGNVSNKVTDAGTDAESLRTPFLSDSAVQHWSPDKPQAEQLKQQRYTPHSSPAHSSNAANLSNVAYLHNQVHTTYPAQHFSGVLSSPALPQTDSSRSYHVPASASGASMALQASAHGSGAQHSASQQQVHMLPRQNNDSAGLPPKTALTVLGLPPKTTWEKVEQEKAEPQASSLSNMPQPSAAESTLPAGVVAPSSFGASFALEPNAVSQAQWARQQLGQKLDLESPRLLESPRGAAVSSRRANALQRVPWAQH